MRQHIIVTEYDPLWPQKFQAESLLIRGILADNCLAIYHIGSTAVPGLAAKPIIDMMAVVKSLAQVDDAAEDFSQIGYEYLGELGIAGRRYFGRAGRNGPTKFTSFRRTIGTISGGTWHFATICAPMKKSGQNMQPSKRSLPSGSPMTLTATVTGRRILCRKWSGPLSPDSTGPGISCILPRERYSRLGSSPRP